MRRTLLVFISCLILAVGAPAVYAHTLEQDGTMSVTLHIDPNDKPLSGKSQLINFVYSDSSKKFDIFGCSCNMTVSDNSGEIYSSIVAPVDQYYGQTRYTFNHDGSYRLKLSGEPRTPGAFKPFSVVFDDINVVSPHDSGNKLPWLASAVLAGVLLLISVSYFLSRR